MSLRDDLVSWWELNEESGTRYDAHGDNDLTDNNTVGYDTGKQGNGADFESSNSESLTKSSATELEPSGAYSFALWFKPESLADLRGVISKEGASKGYLLYTNNDSINFIHQGTAAVTSSTTLTTGTWYFIVCTYSGASEATSGKIYVNAGTPDTANLYPYVDSSNAVFTVGARTGSTGFSDGVKDEIAFWDREITADEVTELYNSGDAYSYADTEEASTGTNTQINIGDTFKTVEEYKLNVGDEWKTVTEMKLNVGDEWKTVF